MVAKSRVAFEQVNQLVGHLGGLNRPQSQAQRIRGVKDSLNRIDKIGTVAEVSTVSTDVNARQDNLLVTRRLECKTLGTNACKVATPHATSNVRDNAVGAEIVATVLNLQESSRAMRTVRQLFKVTNIIDSADLQNFFAAIVQSRLDKLNNARAVFGANNHVDAVNL